MTQTSPAPAPVPVPQPANAARITGTLVSILKGGCGFLYTGKGKPDYFILRADLPPHAWVKGAVVRFTPAPPRAGSKGPRASQPEVVAVPEMEAADAEA